MRGRASLLVLASALTACGPRPLTSAERQQKIVTDVHDTLLGELLAVKAAVVELQATAVTPAGRGWSATEDAAALAAMKSAWRRARTSYERAAGALAPIFPDLDVAIDDRYDGSLSRLGTGGDTSPFDGRGVAGIQAVERILWADAIPARVVQVESALPGYRPAAFPSTEAETRAFKEQLVGQLITDVSTLASQWGPAKMDLPGAWQGLEDLVGEQREKVDLAGDDLEESRYSQRSMRDLRDNLDGARAIYALFQPWLVAAKTDNADGAALDAQIAAGFDALGAAYANVGGDAIPAPPATWSAGRPSPADLMTDFGRLYSDVRSATDPLEPASLSAALARAGVLIGFPAPQ